MEDLSQIQRLFYGGCTEIDFGSLLFNFVLMVIMSFVLKSFYARFSLAVNEKIDIATVIPILSSVIFLVIIVVKSSLALSIGLIGALSIVRFRTPIKEPEELVYLFLAIALGLGYGAGFALVTTVIVLFTLAMIYFLLSNKKIKRQPKYNLIVKWSNPEITLNKVVDRVIHIGSSSKLLRFNKTGDSLSAEFEISSRKNIDIGSITDELHSEDPSINFSLIAAKSNAKIKV